MEELALLESGMINIYSHNKQNERIVSAKELHDNLGVTTRFNDWISRRIKKYGFEEGLDFYSLLSKSDGGRPSTEYYLKLDTAKEIAMVENNEKGREIRRYFIEVEKRFREQVNSFVIPASYSEALRLAADQQEQIEEMKPKVESFENFIDGSNYQKMNDVAKAVGYGRNKLFAFLREMKILMKDNTPYQRFIEGGYFVVKENTIIRGDRKINRAQTYVTSKGVDYISKLLREEGIVD